MINVVNKNALKINFPLNFIATLLVLFVLLCSICIGANADGFEMLDDSQKLADQTIVASGNITKFSSESMSLDGLPSHNNQIVYQVGQSCFSSFENISDKAGLLLIDKYSIVSIAVLSISITSIKVNIARVTLLDCIEVLKRNNESFNQDANIALQQIGLQRKNNEALIELLKKQQSLKHPKKKN